MYVQFSRPVAGCQVLPSTDTSTPATTPPPESAAVPEMVTGTPAWSDLPAPGVVMVAVGGVLSVDRVAAARPDCSVAG